jgi:ubiquinone/menaquinone biosynthesis C-methylase UbiE
LEPPDESRALDRALFLADIQDGTRILEVAIGTGTLFRRIERNNPSGLNEGIDLSPAMLAVARKKMRRERGKYQLMVADTHTLPFADGTIDTVINCYMLDLLPERNYLQTFGEFRRVLRPGGKIILATMTYGHAWYHRFWQSVAVHFPKVLTNCRPVAAAPYLTDQGFLIQQQTLISQNTFPTEIIFGVTIES